MIEARPRNISWRRQAQFLRRDDAQEAAENDDGDLDVQFGPDRLLHPCGQAGQEIADDQTGDQRDDEAAFGGQTQRPADAELLHVGRRVHGKVGVAADDPADVAEPEHRGEAEDEATDIGLQGRSPGRHQHQQSDVSGNQRADPAQAGISFRNRRQRLAQIRPYTGGHHPAENVQAYGQAERKDEHHQTND